MLELGSSTKTLMIGPSATLSDALLEYGAWGFVGSVVDNSHELPDRGGLPYDKRACAHI